VKHDQGGKSLKNLERFIEKQGRTKKANNQDQQIKTVKEINTKG
jgi:hypothetical protein